MRILHIDASPRGERSRSRMIARDFLGALPDSWPIATYDLWAMNLPELDGGMIEGRYDLIMGNAVPAKVAARWAEIEDVVGAFLDHDAYVISTPMWNFGIPYRLKHFVDVVTQPGMAFRNDAQGNVTGLAAGKRSLIIAASAMPFGQSQDLAALDFQAAYLQQWLRFIGVTDIETLHAAPTFGDAQEVAGAMDDAAKQARRLAVEWSAPSGAGG